MLARKLKTTEIDEESAELAPMYGSRELRNTVPRYQLPQHGMQPRSAYQIIHDELNLDGNPALNLASFVTTWMEPEADTLMVESFGRNFIDADEYPQTTEIHNRCVNMIARLFHAHEQGDAVGCATVGSSEAIHLAGLALKWRWRERRRSEGKPTGSPNIVFGANVQVCWEKFARYWDVEPRYVPLSPERYVIGVDEAMELVDENTIGVVGILGSTYTGEFEPISELNDALVQLNAKNGWDVALHVDGASGGFVAPFTRPDLEWDFRLPTVHSINASGHKYGLVYPGVGWVVWRSEEDLPNELIFHVQLPGRRPAYVQPELLQRLGPDPGSVLQLLAPRHGGLHRDNARAGGDRVLFDQSGRVGRPLRDHEPARHVTSGLLAPGGWSRAGARPVHRVRHLGPLTPAGLDCAGLHPGPQRPGHRRAQGGGQGGLFP